MIQTSSAAALARFRRRQIVVAAAACTQLGLACVLLMIMTRQIWLLSILIVGFALIAVNALIASARAPRDPTTVRDLQRTNGEFWALVAIAAALMIFVLGAAAALNTPAILAGLIGSGIVLTIAPSRRSPGSRFW